MIENQLKILMKARGKSFYRLALETGISHQIFLRLASGQTQSITFKTLEALFIALDCTPNDLLWVLPGDDK